MRTYVPNAMKHGRTRMIVRTEAKKTPGWMLFFYYHRRWVATYIGLVLAYYIIFLYNRSPIQHVTFTPETKAQLTAPALWDTIENSLLGASYQKKKLWGRSQRTQEIQRQFPLIKQIRPLRYKDGTATLDIVYYHPDFIGVSNDGVPYLVFRNTLIPYETGDVLSMSGMMLHIAAPAEQLQTFSGGVFFTTSSPSLAQTAKRISFLSGADITFYPGREKLIVQQANKSFVLSSKKETIDTTIKKWKEILPYLPTADPVHIDLSNPDRITIQQ